MKIVKLLRVKHWVKNLLIFFPIVFSGNLLRKETLLQVLYGFILFSLLSSAVYIFNDIRDIEKDKKHPEKKKRPLAAREISVRLACIIDAGLIVSVFLTIFLWGGSGIWYMGTYLIINIGYSMGLKRVPLIDVSILAMGYIIRLLYGGALAGTGVSEWMFLTVMATSFYLSFGKRRNEMLQYGSENRAILKRYNKSFLDKSIQLFMALTIVFYALSCADKNTSLARVGINLLWSVPVVILVCLRYSMILEDGKSDGDPIEVVLRDKPLLGLILFYGISVLFLMYL